MNTDDFLARFSLVNHKLRLNVSIDVIKNLVLEGPDEHAVHSDSHGLVIISLEDQAKWLEPQRTDLGKLDQCPLHPTPL